MNFTSADFGKDFTWGVSSSAYQSEGAYNEDGKGLSIWDVFTALPGKVARAETGKTACEFYHRYMQDVMLMQYMNINNFRFSIAWSRVLPEGIGKLNWEGIAYYDELIDFCLECGITPWITLYHWDLPQALELKGGWTNRDIVQWFSEFTSLCIQKFSDRVKNWMVLNEPMAFTGAGYFLGKHAPGKKGLSAFLPAVHHAVLCQAEGGRVIKSLDSSLNVGTTFSCAQIDPVDNSRSAVEAAQRVDVLTNRLFIEPLLGLGYPAKDLKILYQLEKFMLPGDENKMKFDMDFIGLQNYTREVVQHSMLMPYLNAALVKPAKRNTPHTTMDWEIYPAGIYKMLKKFNEYGRIKRIIVTENGAAFNDQLVDGAVHDTARISFFQTYLANILKAKREGVKVDGYFAWSFTDNFEWVEGYRQRFGLVYIDYPTQKRIIKDSGIWYKNFLKSSVGVAAVKV
jgi:beta-glucosidase